MRAWIAARPALWRWYRQIRRRLLGEAPWPPSPIRQVLQSLADEKAAIRFVQIGSNDASTGDPIIEFVQSYGWQGVLVEPVPYVFERLRRRFAANPRLKLENLAIGSHTGQRPFFCLEPLERPPSRYYDQLGSFSRAHIEKHERYLPGVSAHIREIQVSCTTLTELLKKHDFRQLDLLQVDAEGADFEVLSSLDFDYCTPLLVLFEYGHLIRTEREQCVLFLQARGYRLLYEGRDCLAMHREAGKHWPRTALAFESLSPDV
ncbi:MAG TPA: FkbM family methyltransferase [Nevskiales bacterium]|nr:FkbM family methyltransferase [Nevskiales bacterium]